MLYENDLLFFVHFRFFRLFERYGGRSKGKVKLKRPEQLQKILDVSRYLLGELKVCIFTMPAIVIV